MTRFGRRFAMIVLALFAFAIVTTGRAYVESNTELETAGEHLREGRPTRAVEHYRRALRWSFPSSPYEAQAVAGLESIAQKSEAAGDRDLALLAWRSIVGGLHASRWLYSRPHPAVDRAKDRIARLHALGRPAGVDANLTTERVAAEHRELLDATRRPSPLWASVLLLGFGAWIVSLMLLVGRGFDRAGRLHGSRARAPLWAAVFAFGSFVAGLLLT